MADQAPPLQSQNLPADAAAAPGGASEESVIIVGNGSSLLDGKFGPFIDRHDVVVRFNAFNVSDFPEHAGVKTTVWFNNGPASSPRIKNMIGRHDFDRIYVHTWRETAKAVESFRVELSRSALSCKVIEVDKQDIKQMTLYLGQGYKMFSTGAIAAWLMLKRYKFVTLTGFDWWKPSERFHYFENRRFQHQPGAGHQPLLEKQFFEKLQQENRLDFYPAT